MYCPDCGFETTQGLNYCKRCGASLASDSATAPRFPVLLTAIFLAAILIIMTIGLALPFVAVSELITRGVAIRDLRPLMVLSPMFALGASGLLVWLLLRLIEINKGSRAASGPKQAAANRYGIPPISPQQKVFGSVTEHTTRTFEHEEASRERGEPKVRATR
jgi:hypothetical protein